MWRICCCSKVLKINNNKGVLQLQLDKVTIKNEKIYTKEAEALLNELSETLESITGSSGKASFKLDDVLVPRAMFVIARDEDGLAIGCGAIRPLNDNTAELKRVYTRIKSEGVGKKIVKFLEKSAKDMGYNSICFETRIVNKRAVGFYQSIGYDIIDNYGKYINNKASVCFGKNL